MADQPSGASVSHDEKIFLSPYNIVIIRCDADPAALAKYVLALIKKDKTVDELKVLLLLVLIACK